MVLNQVNENASWIQMTWHCSFIMNWPNILYAVKSISNTFESCDVLAGTRGQKGEKIDPAKRNPECPLLVVQGRSNYFKGNIQITFNTGTSDVVVLAPKNLGFSSDYEILSKAFGGFMDHIELKMFSAK